MSIRVSALLVDIPNVRPYGWDPRQGSQAGKTQGHEFDFMVELKFSKFTKFAIGEFLEFDDTALSWSETIRWYEPDPYPLVESTAVRLGQHREQPKPWKMVREDKVDFASSDYRATTKTVQGGWFGSSFEPGWWEPWKGRKWRDAFEPLVVGQCPIDYDAVGKGEKTPAARLLKQKLAVAKHFQTNGLTLKTYLTDRPGLTKKCTADDGGWNKSGGGGMVTLDRHTRRRVVHFNLGLTALGKMATATQILETVNGEPTINKFIVPGCTMAESESVPLLATWRTQLDKLNIDNFTLAK